MAGCKCSPRNTQGRQGTVPFESQPLPGGWIARTFVGMATPPARLQFDSFVLDITASQPIALRLLLAAQPKLLAPMLKLVH